MDIQAALNKLLGITNTQLPKGPLLADDWGIMQPTLGNNLSNSDFNL